ncbi:ribonuclease H-like domain-containing protein [Desulfonatronospira sp.]|uniref:ribonuclease H-like domain-containing protein n=1 Tax=Desulfonatronospira sp. TaxID=1962951 RepID=UPI0025C142AC|nr:ribonuclease H-like domain-containing protein [Desulfonatronospira sp.]
MLNHSFVHIPTIGLLTEKKIWTSGIRTMEEFIQSPPAFLKPARQQTVGRHIQLSIDKMQNGEAKYFCDNLPTKEQWRLFREYQDSTAYIDIETTGIGDYGDIITTIALYDGKEIKHYINGKNLDEFRHDIMEYKVIVTYNGKTFDIPFIEKYLGISLEHAHLDLRYILKGLGYSGGLKSCEQQLGIGRTGFLQEMDGYFAVLLWYDYKKKRQVKSLETLLAYNVQDVLSLEHLMIAAYNQKIGGIPLKIKPLKPGSPPANPFVPDLPTINRIRKEFLLF